MKISKNELRKMIFETVLQREKALNEVNLRKMRKTIIDAQEEDKKQEDGHVPIFDNPALKGVIDELEVFKKKSKGPFNPNNKPRAQEAEELLRSAKEAKAGQNPAIPEPSKTDPAPAATDSADPAKPEADKDTGDWKKYGDETGWLYKIEGDTPNQIWVTKKAGSDGTEYKLNKPKYAKTVKNLDAADNLPKRTKDSIKNDPALKTPSAKPAAKPVAKPVDNDQKAAAGTRSPDQDSKITTASSPENKSLPTYNFGSSDADWRTTTLRTYSEMPLPRISATGTFFDLDNNSKTRDTALQNIIDWLYTRDVAKGPGGDFSSMTVGARYDLRKARGITGGNWKGTSAKAYKDHIIGIQSGVDSEPMKKIINATIEAFARINNAYNHSLNMKAKNGNTSNESKVIYGKSHATLLRERYWGRY